MIRDHDDMVRSMAAHGNTLRQIAETVSATPSGVLTYIKRHGIRIDKSRRPKKGAKVTARSEDMRQRYQRGDTLEVIGADYGITRERVRQILHRAYGFRYESGGQFLQATFNKAAHISKIDARCIQKNGCSRAQYREMLECCRHLDLLGLSYERQPIGAYQRQKHNAGTRGIAWEFTFWSWWTLWKDSEKWWQRGRHAGGYVMCRYGDAGPYSPSNCYIALNSENSRHMLERRHGDLTEFSTAREAA